NTIIITVHREYGAVYQTSFNDDGSKAIDYSKSFYYATSMGYIIYGVAILGALVAGYISDRILKNRKKIVMYGSILPMLLSCILHFVKDQSNGQRAYVAGSVFNGVYTGVTWSMAFSMVNDVLPIRSDFHPADCDDKRLNGYLKRAYSHLFVIYGIGGPRNSSGIFCLFLCLIDIAARTFGAHDSLEIREILISKLRSNNEDDGDDDDSLIGDGNDDTTAYSNIFGWMLPPVLFIMISGSYITHSQQSRTSTLLTKFASNIEMSISLACMAIFTWGLSGMNSLGTIVSNEILISLSRFSNSIDPSGLANGRCLSIMSASWLMSIMISPFITNTLRNLGTSDGQATTSNNDSKDGGHTSDSIEGNHLNYNFIILPAAYMAQSLILLVQVIRFLWSQDSRKKKKPSNSEKP
ncbi:hypothetical protein H4219_003346, partial [Mycoemilia scoparia]